MHSPTAQSIVAKLEAHANSLRQTRLIELFNNDAQRYARFSTGGPATLWVDFSKQRITEETLSLLIELAGACGLPERVTAMFDGERINTTEGRAVLHTALRKRDGTVKVDGVDIMPAVEAVRAQMRRFCDAIHSGRWRGMGGKPIKHVVNIGIGGSDLGPKMVCRALAPYADRGVETHFVSNIDGADLATTLRLVEPETTLFVVASKTFTTQETLTNAHSAKRWLLAHWAEHHATNDANGVDQATAIARHFVAVSTNQQEVREFGIDPENMFVFWDWVGGRYSLWSAIGLPIALGIGMERFESLLRGAEMMDEHFRTTPIRHNIPALLGLLGVWAINFWDAQSHAILPYDQSLALFPAYLQQADMESNGKSVTHQGNPVDYATAPVIWGEPGTNGQHAFFQALHQGKRHLPADFIAPLSSHYPMGDHHTKLLANFFAQTEALMRGKSADMVRSDLEKSGTPPQQIARLIPHKTFEGDRPTTSIVMDRLTPEALGALIAMYEHKIFVQGVLWDVNSFDQWGVELGKELARTILDELTHPEGPNPNANHDASTLGLMARYRDLQGQDDAHP
jgi:glucose-6-phosphate isomerase